MMIRKIFIILILILVSNFKSNSQTYDPVEFVSNYLIINKITVETKDTPHVSVTMQKFITDWISVPYKWGGINKNGIDCSALVQKMAKQVFGVDIPRTVATQIKSVKIINTYDPLKIGDLIFFRSKASPSGYHVGFYLWDNKFMHAAGKKIGVIIANLNIDKVYMVGRLTDKDVV